MAKPVEIKSVNVTSTKNIVAMPDGVRFTGKGDIQFRNYLDQPVTLKFYYLDAKGTGVPIPDFCKGKMSGTLDDEFVITATNTPSPKVEKCEIEQAGEFAYTVTAPGYNALDPVIIIDPQMQAKSGAAASLVAVAALLVGVGALAYYLGHARGKTSS